MEVWTRVAAGMQTWSRGELRRVEVRLCSWVSMCELLLLPLSDSDRCGLADVQAQAPHTLREGSWGIHSGHL